MITRIGVVVTDFLNVALIQLDETRTVMTGTMGNLLHPFMIKLFKNVTYVPVIGLGTLYLNNTCDGALNMFKEDKIDVFFKAEPMGIQADFIMHTKAISSASIHMGHHIEIPIKNSDLFQIFSNFSLQIWILYLVLIFCMLSILSIKLAFHGIRWCHLPSRLILCFGLFLRQIPKFDLRPSRIAPNLTLILLLTVFLINFIFETLIKTDKVVIDTSSIINSVDDALRSDRLMGWGVEERVNLEFSQAQPGTWQNKIWSKKKFWVQKTITQMRHLLIWFKKLMAIQDIVYLQILFFQACDQMKMGPFWVSTKPVLELVENIYISKISCKRFQLHFKKTSLLQDHIENGIYAFNKKAGVEAACSLTERRFCIYNDFESLKSRILIKTDSLKLDNFKRIFFFLFYIYFGYLIVFIFQYLFTVAWHQILNSCNAQTTSTKNAVDAIKF